MKAVNPKNLAAIFIPLLIVTGGRISAQNESAVAEAPMVPTPAPALPQPPGESVSVPALGPRRLMGWNLGDRYAPAGCVLVIPNTKIQTEDLLATIEDLTIMSRVFDKKLAHERMIPATSRLFARGDDALFQRFFSQHNRSTEAIYLQGYGAMFFINVDFPLWTPVETPEQETSQDVDKVWEEAKIDVYNLEKDSGRGRTQEEEKYDAEQVAELKETLIKALKHAANIRCMKSQEWLNIIVKGKSPGDVIKAVVNAPSGRSSGLSRYDALAFVSKATTTGDSTFLSIRAKKQDIDAFVEGTLDYEQFRRRAEVLTY